MTSRRILGIDPGSRLTGYGILEITGTNPPRCLAGGTIRLTAKEVPARLGLLYEEVQNIVHLYQPNELAIEQVFVHKNARSALLLGQARGVILAAVTAKQLQVFEYAPRKIKQAITGSGGADKSQIQHMCKILLNLNEQPQADAADALAVALCHLNSSSMHKKLTSWRSYDRSIAR